MVFLLDPVAIAAYMLGYVVMIALASTVAPKVANKVSGRFSLYASMAILSVLIVALTASVIYVILSIVGLSYISITGLIIFVIIANIIMYLVSPYMINAMYGAKHDPSLQMIVNNVAQRLGYKKPPKAVVVNGPPNAFAYGNIISGKYVAVTRTMLRLTDRKELEAVIGHEIGHHMHRDNAIMLLLGILPSVIYYLGISLIHLTLWGGNRRNGNPGVLIAVGILAIIVSFIVQILVLAFSRLREYFADIEGAKAAGKEAMQKALAKIHIYYSRDPEAKEIVSESKFRTLFIYALVESVANPFYNIGRSEIERLMRMKISPVAEILSTHPPIPKRLKFLEDLEIGYYKVY